MNEHFYRELMKAVAQYKRDHPGVLEARTAKRNAARAEDENDGGGGGHDRIPGNG